MWNSTRRNYVRVFRLGECPPRVSSYDTHLKNSGAIGQQAGTNYFDQASDHNPEPQQPFGPITYDDLDGGNQAFPEVENGGQVASLVNFDTGSDDQVIDHYQGTPVPTRQASLPLTAPVEANTDNSTIG